MYLKLRVVTSSKKEVVEKVGDDLWYLWIREPAENNLANRRILEIIKESFPDQAIRIVSGHHSPSKIVSIG